MIDLTNVSKTYKTKDDTEVIALDDVTLHIDKGSIHGIVGQSGAGKSTLIRCLTALERPTSGHIVVDDVDMTAVHGKQLREARRRIGMVFQSANLLDSRTVEGNIAYPLKIAKHASEDVDKRVGDLLTLVGLSGRGSSYPSQLSGGQRQRVGIARALADTPAVLLCDEPTSALDQESTRQILGLLSDLRHRLGVTIVMITHEMSVVREICDSATLLKRGAVEQTGTIKEIMARPGSQLAQDLIPTPNVDGAEVPGDKSLLDVTFTSSPGIPTGASVLNLAASMGADVTAGVFESIGSTQVGRIVLAVPSYHAEQIAEQMRDQGFYVRDKQAVNA